MLCAPVTFRDAGDRQRRARSCGGAGRGPDSLGREFPQAQRASCQPAHPSPTAKETEGSQDLGLCSNPAAQGPVPGRAGWCALLGGPFLPHCRKLAATHWFQAVSEGRTRGSRASEQEPTGESSDHRRSFQNFLLSVPRISPLSKFPQIPLQFPFLILTQYLQPFKIGLLKHIPPLSSCC